MSRMPQQQPGQTRNAELSDAELLERVMAMTPVKKFKAIDEALKARIDQIEDLLPDMMKGQGDRLAKRAILTLSRKGDLKDVTATSFVRCVLEAAEFGLAIDGRLAHAVVFNNKLKIDGKDVWQAEAQLMIDYKGILAVARRTKLIVDCWARLVCEKDEFSLEERDGASHYAHVPALSMPGATIGAYAVVKLPEGNWRHEWMSIVDLNAIRGRSKSFSKGGGPWKTDPGEMQKKTVIRRLLKMYGDDPAIIRLMEVEDRDYEDDEPEVPKVELPVGRSKIRRTPAPLEPAATSQESPPDDRGEQPPQESQFTEADEQPPETKDDGEIIDRPDTLKADGGKEGKSADADMLFDDLCQSIEQSTTTKQLDAIRNAYRQTHRYTLGEALYAKLVAICDTRYKSLLDAQPKKTN